MTSILIHLIFNAFPHNLRSFMSVVSKAIFGVKHIPFQMVPQKDLKIRAAFKLKDPNSYEATVIKVSTQKAIIEFHNSVANKAEPWPWRGAQKYKEINAYLIPEELRETGTKIKIEDPYEYSVRIWGLDSKNKTALVDFMEWLTLMLQNDKIHPEDFSLT